jgi:hypothetical protein
MMSIGQDARGLLSNVAAQVHQTGASRVVVALASLLICTNGRMRSTETPYSRFGSRHPPRQMQDSGGAIGKSWLNLLKVELSFDVNSVERM